MATGKQSLGKPIHASHVIRALILLNVLLMLNAFTPLLFSAESVQPGKKTPDTATTKTAGEELPKEVLTLQTGDKVQLSMTYYPGRKGKESVPVVLLHGYGKKHNRTDYTMNLAPYLQSQGFAVIVPDLRGHGESTRLRTVRGKDETLDAASLAPNQFPLMVTQDMKAIKDFLWEKNNAGELNLDKLCIVGSEMGASIAMEFAWYDAVEQDTNPVLRPEYKIGRFVKALVLISPEISFKGISMRHAMQNSSVRNDISVLVMVGKGDSTALSEAKRVYSLFERDHPKPDPEKKAEQQTLFFKHLETTLQGTSLFTDKNLTADEIVAAFINLRLVKSDQAKTWTWKERKMPHQ